jgi:hypothetical protein
MARAGTVPGQDAVYVPHTPHARGTAPFSVHYALPRWQLPSCSCQRCLAATKLLAYCMLHAKLLRAVAGRRHNYMSGRSGCCRSLTYSACCWNSRSSCKPRGPLPASAVSGVVRKTVQGGSRAAKDGMPGDTTNLFPIVCRLAILPLRRPPPVSAPLVSPTLSRTQARLRRRQCTERSAAYKP